MPMRAVVVIPLMVFWAGCAPKILRYSVSPQVVCGRAPVSVSWRALGASALRTTLRSASRQPGSPIVEDYTLVVIRGNRTPTETDHTCNLSDIAAGESARCGRSVVQRRQVQRYPAQVVDTLGEAVTLHGDSLAIHVSLGANFTAAGVRITGISNIMRRPLRVEHAGHTAVVAADNDAVSHEFDGVSPGGEWRISTAMTPIEQADPSREPRGLVLRYEAVCQEEVAR